VERRSGSFVLNFHSSVSSRIKPINEVYSLKLVFLCLISTTSKGEA